MSRAPVFSLRSDLPRLNQPGFLYAGAHIVGDDDRLHNTLRPESIDSLLTAARKAGYSVSLLDPNPRKLILTFDDGRRFSDGLVTVLDRHGATAIFCVCSERLIQSYADEPHYWEMTDANRQYVLANHIVGGHTHQHVDFGALPAAEQRSVLAESAARFRDWFGFDPWCFAYPWGHYRGETLRALRDLGVRYAFIAAPGLFPIPRYIIPRVFLDEGDWPLGDFDFVLRRTAEVKRNADFAVRGLHAAVSLAWGIGPRAWTRRVD
jgi:peptidoglycan/xylan/chitin deacetylase (PgdA/CDA1 family)